MKKILITLGVVALLVGVVYASKVVTNIQAKTRNSRLSEDVDNLFNALQKYKERAGAYPAGSNADIAKALNGANAKSVIVLVGRKTELNEKGEFVDPWGTPLRIYFSDNSILIRSAGANRRFDDSTVLEADDFIRSN